MAKKFPGGLITSTTIYPADGGVWTTADTAKYTGADTWTTNDPYRKSVILEIQADTTAPVYNTDASSNALTVVPAGSARPDLNNPFLPTTGLNYPVYFGGAAQLTTAANSAAFATGVGDFTAECWIYISTPGIATEAIASTTAGGSNAGWHWYISNTNGMGIRSNSSNWVLPPSAGLPGSAGYIPTNSWMHVAYTRRANVHACWMNGTLTNSATQTVSWTDNVLMIGNSNTGQFFNGYINNFRFVNGVALYGASVPTTLAANVTGTSLLLNVTSAPTYITDSSANAFTVLNPATYPITYSTLTPVDAGGSLVTANLVYQQLFTSNATWVCPAGVTSVSAVAVGAGGGGNSGWSGHNGYSGGEGGGGGGLGWRNNISVTPGTSYTVVVGSRGIGGPSSLGSGGVSIGGAGGDSYFINRTTVLGVGGSGAINNTGGAGGSFLGDGGGLGGTGGTTATGATFATAGGGGGGGYTGAGGNGMFGPTGNVTTAGTGGGAGGGLGYYAGNAPYPIGTGGGGVGVLGQGTSGNAAPGLNQETFGGSADYAPGGALFFNGSSSYLTVPANAAFSFGTGDFTMECWIYTRSLAATQQTIDLFSNASGSYIVGQCQLQLLTTGAVALGYATAASAATFFGTAASAVTINSWYHIAVVRSGSAVGNLKIYVNGVLAATSPGALTQAFGTTGGISIGRQTNDSSNVFSGYITNARIVKGVAVYTGNFTPPTAPLTATQTGNPILNIQAIASSSSTSLLLLSANSAAYITDSSTTPNTITNTGVIYRLTTPFGTGNGGGARGWAVGAPGGITTLGYNPGGDFGGGGGGGSDNSGQAPIGGYGGQGAVRIIWGPGRSFPNTLTTDQSLNIQYLQVANNAAFQVGAGDFAVDLWIYPTTVVGLQRVFSISNSTIASNADEGIVLELNNAAMTATIYSGVTAYTITESAGVLSPNTWYYYRLIRTGTTLSLYRTAGLSGSVAVSTVSVNWSASFQTYIGAWINGPSRPFVGYITNIRVVKGTLVIVTGNFTPSTVPLTAVQDLNVNGFPSAAITAGQTKLLALQNSTFVDNSGNNLTLTNTNAAIRPTQARAPFASALTLSGDNATLGSTYFNGTTDYFTIADAPEFNIGVLNTTLEAWIWTTLTTPTGAVFAKRGTTALFSGYQLAFASTLAPVFNASTDGATWTVAITSNASIKAGLWNHVAVTKSSNTWSLWVNGNISGTATVAGNVHTNVAPLSIGSGAGTTPGLYWTGYISNFRKVLGIAVYTGNFTPSTSSLTSTQASGTNITAIDQPVVKNYSVYLNGVNQYLTAPNNAGYVFGAAEFTVETWIYVTDITRANASIVSLWTTAGGKAFQMRTMSGNIRVDYNTTLFQSSPSSVIAANTWYHVAWVKSTANSNVYLNGSLVSSVAAPVSITASTALLSVGFGLDGQGTTYYFPGYISNMRLVKGTAVYTANFTPASAALTSSQTADQNGVPSRAIVGAGSTSYSYSFSGSNYLTIPTSTTFQFGTGNFTAEAWVYRSVAWTAQNIFFGQWSGSTGGTTLSWVVLTSNDTNGYARFALSVDGSTVLTDSVSSSVIALNQWNHLAFVRNGNTFTLYLNGTSVVTYSSGTPSLYAATNTISIGASSAGTQPFTGYISNFRIVKSIAVYTTTFTPATASLTNVQTANQNGLPSAAITYATAYSGAFNGSTQYLYVPGTNPQFAFGTGDYTIEMWIYQNARSINYGNLYDSRPAGTSSSASHLGFGVDPAGAIFGSTISLKTWYHVALVRVGTLQTGYVNGVAVSSVTDTTNWLNGTDRPIFGTDGNVPLSPGYIFNGYITNLRVVKGVAVYTGNFTVPTLPLATTQSSSSSIAAITGSQTSMLTLQGAAITDASAYVNTITNVGGTTTSLLSPTLPPKYYYASFTGTTTLSLPFTSNFVFPGDFTVEGWFYFNSLPTGSNQVYLVGDWQASSNQRSFLLAVTYSGGQKINFLISIDGLTGVGSTFDLVVNWPAATINTWYHIAAVRVSGSVNIYVNGVAQTRTTNDITTQTNFNSGVGGQINIGASAYSAVYFNGYMSNLRIVKGVAAYTGNFTPPTVQLSTIQTAGSNIAAVTGTQTSLLILQNSTIIDNSANSATITNAGGISIATDITQIPAYVIILTAQAATIVDNSTLPVSITNTGTVTSIAVNPFTSTTSLLIAQSRTIVDTSGGAIAITNQGVTGVSVNNPFTAYAGTSVLTSQYNVSNNNNFFSDNSFNNYLIVRAGTATQGSVNPFVTGWSYQFNGSTDYYTVSTAIEWAFLHNGIEDWTVRFWVYPRSSSLMVPLSTTNVAGQTGISIELNNTTYGGVTGSMSVVFFNATGSAVTNPAFNSNPVVVLNQWNYIAVSFTANTKTVGFYINGLAAGSSSLPSFVYNTAAPTNTLNIGRNPAGTAYFSGYISNLQIDKGVQSTLQPIAPLTTVAGTGTYSVLFNGSTSYLATSVLATRLLTSDYTVEAWIYPTAAATGTTYATSVNILGANSGVTSYQTWGITNAGYIVAARDGLSYQTITATTPSLNTWTHIAFVNRSNTVTVYLAGNRVGSITQTGTWGITATDTIIGGWGGTGGKFTGHISNLRIINGQGLYTANFTPSTSALSSTALNFTYIFSASYLISANEVALQLGTGDFTIESWVYYTTTVGPTYFVGTGLGTGTYRIGVDNATGAVVFYSGNNILLITTPNTTTINTWAYVAVVRSGSVTTAYVNGQAATSAIDTANYSIGVTAIGSGSATTTSSWAGYITNLRIIKGAAIYRSTAFTVPTSELTSITQSTAPYSVYLNGSSYLTATSNSFVMGTGDFTVECFVWVDPAADSLAGIVTGTTQTTSGFVLARNGAGMANANGAGANIMPWTIPTSTWTHVALTMQSNRLFAFINGTFISSLAATFSNLSNTVRLGSRYADSNPFPFIGYISNLRILSGVALYTTVNFLPPTTSLTAIANTVFLTAQSATAIDNSTNAISITATGNPAFNSGGSSIPFGSTSLLAVGAGPWGINFTSTGSVNGTITVNPFGAGVTRLLTASSATIVDSGYSAYTVVNNAATVSTASPFAAGTSLLTLKDSYAVDQSVYARTLTRAGTPTVENFSPYPPAGSWSNSAYGGTVVLNGTTDYLNLPASSLVLGISNFTLECWFYSFGLLTAQPKLIDNFIGIAAAFQTGQWQLGFSATGLLQFGYATGVSTTVYVTGTVALLPNQFYHVAVVRTGTGTNQITIYVNGAVYAQGTIADSFGVAGTTTGGSIGRQTGSNTLFFNGYIGGIRLVNGTALYTSAFTPPAAPPTTVANTALLIGNTVTSAINDPSSRSAIRSVAGAAQVVNSVYRYGTGSVYFNGSSNYLTVPYSDVKFNFGAVSDFTIEFWMRAAALPGTTAQLFDTRPASTNGAYHNIYLSSDGTVRYYVSTADRITSTASAIAINTWYHIALVRYVNTTTLYINGVVAGTPWADTTAYVSAAIVLIGASYSGGAAITNYFNGYIDDLRVTKSVARYTGAFTPPSKIVS